jgi:uncharacterized protein with HEPN domain
VSLVISLITLPLLPLQVLSPARATKKLAEEIRIGYPQIPWDEMAGMRDVLIHNYFGIDNDVVWNTITKDIPELAVILK